MFKMNAFRAQTGLRIGVAVTLFGTLLACAQTPKTQMEEEALWWHKRKRTRIASIGHAPQWPKNSPIV